MYHVVAIFDVRAVRHQEFIAAALEDVRNSLVSEPGTRRFELIKDEARPNRFCLNEVYDDEAAFHLHEDGPHYKRFFDVTRGFA